MTPEQFKDIRTNYINAPREFLSRYLTYATKYGYVDIKSLENGEQEIPDSLAAYMIEFSTQWQCLVLDILDSYAEKDIKSDRLIVYVSDEELKEFAPEDFEFFKIADMHQLFLTYIEWSLTNAYGDDYTGGVVFFDRENYSSWLEERNQTHSKANLRRWAHQNCQPLRFEISQEKGKTYADIDESEDKWEQYFADVFGDE